MPILPNPRHERFAQFLAQGKSAAEAHVLAGYKPNRHNAWSRKQKEHIKKRLNELLEERQKQDTEAVKLAVERVSLTKEWVIAKLIENAEAALRDRDGSVANRALELLGKELGLFIDRSEVRNVNEFGGLSAEQARLELIKHIRELGFDAASLGGLLEDATSAGSGLGQPFDDDARPN